MGGEMLLRNGGFFFRLHFRLSACLDEVVDVVSCWFLVEVAAFGWADGAGYGIRGRFGDV